MVKNMIGKNKNNKTMSAAMSFIILFGIVSLFSDMTHEGASSIRGTYLSLIGASAGTIGFVSWLENWNGWTEIKLSSYAIIDNQTYTSEQIGLVITKSDRVAVQDYVITCRIDKLNYGENCHIKIFQ